MKDIPYIISGKITEHFWLCEFCNTQAKDYVKLVITPAFIEHVQMLEELRTVLGLPIDVNSGYRTPSFNKECGGDENSAHLVGLATDIKKLPVEDIVIATAWKTICAKHNKIGGINFYTRGYHLCSDEGRFGNTEFIVREYRGTKHDW